MTYLIDTQVLIWFQLDSKSLKPSIRSLLIDSENTIFISQISLIEISIKQKLGKLNKLEKSIEELIYLIENDGIQILRLDNSHIASYNSIPLFEEHRDPFDRLLIATALSEEIPLISADEKFKLYNSIITVIEA